MNDKLPLACAIGAIAAALVAVASVVAGFSALPRMIADQNYSGIVAAFAGAFAVSIAFAVCMVIIAFCCGIFFVFSALLAVLFFRLRAGKPLTKGRLALLCVALLGDAAALFAAIFLCAMPAYPATIAAGALLFAAVAVNLALRIVCIVRLKCRDNRPPSDASAPESPLR